MGKYKFYVTFQKRPSRYTLSDTTLHRKFAAGFNDLDKAEDALRKLKEKKDKSLFYIRLNTSGVLKGDFHMTNI